MSQNLIYFIHDEDCKDCIRMEAIIDSCIKGKDNFEVDRIDSTEARAFDIAIEFGIEDLPGCVIIDKEELDKEKPLFFVTYGKRFDRRGIKKYING